MMDQSLFNTSRMGRSIVSEHSHRARSCRNAPIDDRCRIRVQGKPLVPADMLLPWEKSQTFVRQVSKLAIVKAGPREPV